LRNRLRAMAGVGVVLVCAALLVPAGAFAAHGGSTLSSPTANQYSHPSPPQGTQASGSNSPSGGSGGEQTIAGLPFTGADLGVLGAMAVVLVGGGLALRRIARSESA